METYRDGRHGRAIDDYIAHLSEAEGERVAYPIGKEQELFRAVARGDSDAAGTLLNQILGHIYYYAADSEEVYLRIMELFVVLIRAAACGGADAGYCLGLSRRYLGDIRRIKTQEELTQWLASSLRRLMEQVFRVPDVKHAAAIRSATAYMKQRCALRLTLEEVAEHVGYSPAYFSRVFREDTGLTFQEYLNELRVEKSKPLLLDSRLTIAEVGAMTGFSSQSYFSKVFKKAAGVTPDQFRKRASHMEI